MAKLTINNWGGGIGDDVFLARDGECLDMEGIDIRTTPRKISCSGSFLGSNAQETAPYNTTLRYVTESIEGVVQSYDSYAYIGGGNITSLIGGGAYAHITVGNSLIDYNSSTNPEGIRHFFFQYNNSTNPIKVVGYNGGARSLLSTLNTSGGASPSNIPALYNTSAVCYLWKGAVIFARGSKIYELNPETVTLSAGAKIELPVGSNVKYITYQGGLISIVYTIGNDTYIHGCSYDGTTYKLYPYADKKVGEKCLSAVTDGSLIYWISTTGIFIYNGKSQLVKRVQLTADAKCSYNKSVLRIGDGLNFYEYGVNKPGYGNPLTKIESPLSIHGVTENYVMTFQSGLNKFRIDSVSSAYKNGYYIFHPYTAGLFGVNKKSLAIRVGYFLPRGTYTDPTIQCSIEVSVQTLDMYAQNSTNYVTVCTISDKSKTNREITMREISTALGNAGYSDEFAYFRLKLKLNAGDKYSGYSSDIFRKTPEVYDIDIIHEEIDKSF